MTCRGRTARRCALVLALSLVQLLSGCAGAPKPGRQADPDHWQGRLALKVFASPVQSLSASFDLQGQPEQGALTLSSPLGTTLAQLQWSPGSAILIANGERQHFATLRALARKATGTDLPLESLFAWLRGTAEQAPGWQVDLTELPRGRLQARHIEDVQAELKIILEP